MRILIALLITLVSSNALAIHSCSGKVLSVDINARDHVVAVEIEGMEHGNTVCSLVATEGFVEPNECEAMFSTLLAAYSSGNTVKLWFNDDSDTSCLKGPWGSLTDHGFYYLRSM